MKKKELKDLEELEKIIALRDAMPMDENREARERLKATLHQLADDLAEVLSNPVKNNVTPISAGDEMKIYSPEQLTKKLGVVKDTLTTWRREGRGPKFFKEGRNVFYRERDILEWINGSKTYTKTIEQWVP